MSSLTTKLRNLKDYRCVMSAEVKDEIIVEYAPLVKFIAQKIASRLPANIELDDLISCGVIGLMDAISKFDPNRDNKFKTYAEFRIRGAILDELRSQDWVPRSVREKSKQLEKAYAKLEREFGRPATDDEMCEELQCSVEEFHELLNKSKSVSLLNIDDSATFNKGDKKLMMGLLEHRRSSNPYAAVNYKKAQSIIKDGIKSLPEKQRLVLSLYYFEDLNLKEIGQVLDVTESRVSQLHTQAIMKLKAKLKNDFDSHEDIAV
jgi:RNA polymerase sigma factor FliA